MRFNKFTVATSLALLAILPAAATLDVSTPIYVSQEVEAWVTAYSAKVQDMKTKSTYPADGYTECRATNEVPGAYLCLSNTQVGMNSSLGRASMFIEGLGDPRNKGVVLRQDNPAYLQFKRLIGGHDLRAADLLRFHAAMTSECEKTKDAQICPNAYEKDIFDNLILPYSQRDSNFVVISFASQSMMSWREVVTHEIMHAQYFNDSRFRQISDDFWANELTEDERQAIKKRLGTAYDASDELLMKNEFQAYILMAGAERNMLYDYVAKFRGPLMKKLNDAGVVPVQVQ